MYVASTNRSWLQMPFFRKMIKDQSAIAKLRAYRVTDLVIDTNRGKDLDTGAESHPVSPFNHPEILHQNLSKSSAVHKQAVEKTGEIMDAVRDGKDLDEKTVGLPVDQMMDMIIEDPQSLLCVSVLKNTDEFTFNHCVNTAILGLFLGKTMGLSEAELLRLGKGALLHDIGKCMIPKEILAKPGRLSSEEVAEVQTHVARGVKYLGKMKNLPVEVIHFTQDHHERLDGSGYPRGLLGDAISWHGRVGAVLDVYDALIHENYYKTSDDPNAVLEIMKKDVGTQYDEKAFNALSDCLGTHPPGSILMLDTGEVAITFAPDIKNPFRPKVLLMTREDGSFCEHPIPIELTETLPGESSFKRSIVTVMSLEEIPFDPFKILDNYSLQSSDIG